MSPFDALIPYWNVGEYIDCGDYWVTKITSKKRDEIRVVYRIKSEKRCHLSPATSHSFATLILTEAVRDRKHGGKFVGLKHTIRIFSREVMPFRWKEHRKRINKRKEARQMEALPQFGMF